MEMVIRAVFHSFEYDITKNYLLTQTLLSCTGEQPLAVFVRTEHNMVHAITTTGQPFRYISKRLIFLIGLLPGYFCQSERQLVVHFTYQEYTTITNISIAAKTILPLPKPGDRSELEIKLPLGLHIRSEKNNNDLCQKYLTQN